MRKQLEPGDGPLIVVANEFLDALPRTESGKVQWRQLQDRERARAAGAP